ncbi:MAG: site-2 protease family protein [Syntrophomonadaceae bacterium]|nr:site-2 protease family protein [Syntrophomonadaceae bacterium]
MQWILDTIIWLPAMLIGITFHEYAHGRVAYYLGDNTPLYQGRLTLNPIPHIDPMGFLMLILFRFGWAKPVMVNPINFKTTGIKKGMMLVSLAGPLVNLIIAFLALLAYKYLVIMPPAGWKEPLLLLVHPIISINLVLAAFNLIPLPPLDGSKILAGVLSDKGAQTLYSLERYGPLILLVLIMSGAVSAIIGPIINLLYRILYLLVF